MNVELAIGGLFWLALGFGHAAIGRRWLLPSLDKRSLPGTPVGPPAMTLGMLRFTWHVVSIMLLGFGALFLALAFAPGADPRRLVLGWFAAFALVATTLAVWQARRRPRSLLLPPVAPILVAIAAICWAAW